MNIIIENKKEEYISWQKAIELKEKKLKEIESSDYYKKLLKTLKMLNNEKIY